MKKGAKKIQQQMIEFEISNCKKNISFYEDQISKNTKNKGFYMEQIVLTEKKMEELRNSRSTFAYFNSLNERVSEKLRFFMNFL